MLVHLEMNNDTALLPVNNIQLPYRSNNTIVTNMHVRGLHDTSLVLAQTYGSEWHIVRFTRYIVQYDVKMGTFTKKCKFVCKKFQWFQHAWVSGYLLMRKTCRARLKQCCLMTSRSQTSRDVTREWTRVRLQRNGHNRLRRLHARNRGYDRIR